MFESISSKIEYHFTSLNNNVKNNVKSIALYISQESVKLLRNIYITRSMDMIIQRKSYLPIIRELSTKLFKEGGDNSIFSTLLDYSLIKISVIAADFKILYTSNNWISTLGNSDNLCCFQYFEGTETNCEDCIGKKVLTELIGGCKVKTFRNGKTYLSAYYPLRNNGDRYILVISFDVTRMEDKKRYYNMFNDIVKKLETLTENEEK